MSGISFENGNEDHPINSFNKYYMSLVEIKDFNALIDNKQFRQLVKKNKQEAYENLTEMSRNDDYITENFLETI